MYRESKLLGCQICFLDASPLLNIDPVDSHRGRTCFCELLTELFISSDSVQENGGRVGQSLGTLQLIQEGRQVSHFDHVHQGEQGDDGQA